MTFFSEKGDLVWIYIICFIEKSLSRKVCCEVKYRRGHDRVRLLLRGFTLIELLVVISIIALLLAILLPSLKRVREQAKKVICMSHLRQWGVIIPLYTTEHQDSYPSGIHYDAMYNNGVNQHTGQWMVALEPYYENRKILFCAKAKRLLSQSASAINPNTTAWGVIGDTWGPDYEGYGGSYGWNAWVYNPTEGFAQTRHWKKASNVKGAANVPVMGGSWYFGSWPDSGDTPPADEYTMWNGTSMSHFCNNRHRGKTNLVFADSSVRSVGLKKLWGLRWHPGWIDRGRTVWPEWMEDFD